VALHPDYAALDLRNVTSPAYGVGAQPGILFQPTKELSLGVTYISPQSTDFSNAINFGGQQFDLEMEAPQQAAFGAVYELFDGKLLVEANVKWINWSGAKGYEDFDWNDQWVFSVGAQCQVIPDRLFFRAGYNFGENPVEKHNGWSPADTVNVQGAPFPGYYYETFRVIGFPAIVEHHLTAGLGYRFSDRFSLDAGFVYAFSNSIKERGFGFSGPVTIASELEEYGADFGLSWRF